MQTLLNVTKAMFVIDKQTSSLVLQTCTAIPWLRWFVGERRQVAAFLLAILMFWMSWYVQEIKGIKVGGEIVSDITTCQVVK